MCATTAMNTPSFPDKTVVLFGAPRTDGATGTLLNLYTSVCKGDVTVFDCFARRVTPCDDCRYCHGTLGCAKRDMDDIYEAVEKATTLVIVTPVYNRSFPAPLKAVIDRFQRYWAARFVHGVRPPVSVPKKAVLLTTAGSDRDDGELLMTQLAPQLTILNVGETAQLHVKNTDREVDWQTVADKLENI